MEDQINFHWIRCWLLFDAFSGECFSDADISIFELSHFSIDFGVGKPKLDEIEADGFIFHVLEDVEGIKAEACIL